MTRYLALFKKSFFHKILDLPLDWPTDMIVSFSDNRMSRASATHYISLAETTQGQAIVSGLEGKKKPLDRDNCILYTQMMI